jgi:hypothetical protein
MCIGTSESDNRFLCNTYETKLSEPLIARTPASPLGVVWPPNLARQGMLDVLIQFATTHPLTTVAVISVLSVIVMRAALS